MSYRLLIVDDEVLIRKALSQYIDWESLNCVVHATASNGKEAIKIIEENKIDIVITDVNAADRWNRAFQIHLQKSSEHNNCYFIRLCGI